MMTRSKNFRPIAQEIVFILGQGDQIEPIGRLFTMDSFWKFQKKTQKNLGLLFSTVQVV
jgi:hypothetical protein